MISGKFPEIEHAFSSPDHDLRARFGPVFGLFFANLSASSDRITGRPATRSDAISPRCTASQSVDTAIPIRRDASEILISSLPCCRRRLLIAASDWISRLREIFGSPLPPRQRNLSRSNNARLLSANAPSPSVHPSLITPIGTKLNGEASRLIGRQSPISIS
jgi:hypothetical protein